MKKIVISTTFRDFDDSVNDKMQLMFLEGLKRQTYQEYILVVSLFGEKRVKTVVQDVLKEKAVFVDNTIDEDYRYSLTRVIKNGIDYAIRNQGDVLLDCSGDILLQNNFLETIVKFYKPLYSGITHPNVFYEIKENQMINKHRGSCARGIDVRFFDVKLFENLNVYKCFEKYSLYDWGGIEHFTTAICLKYSPYRINVFRKTKAFKVENDRDAANESNEYVCKSSIRNLRVIRRLSLHLGISYSMITDLYYLHLVYKNPHFDIVGTIKYYYWIIKKYI